MGEAKAASTKNGHSVVQKILREYCEVIGLTEHLPTEMPAKKMGYKAGDTEIPVKFHPMLTAGFLQGFAEFLYTAVEDGDGGEDHPRFTMSTASTYISNAHTVLELYFGKGCIEMIDPKGTSGGERNATGDWYSTLLKDTEKSYMTRCINLGLPVKKKARSFGEYELNVVCRILLKENTPEADELRFAFVALYAACGRGGEVGDTLNDSLV